MPTIEQIRAARALLGWNQHDLADKASLSQTGIARIENGTNQPNSKTLEKIRSAFDTADIEFLDTSGVRKRPEGRIEIHTGHEGFVRFVQHVYETLKTEEAPEVVVNNVSEDLFVKWEGDYVDIHQKRMEEINAHYKIIVEEGDTNFTASEYAEYRWIPASSFSPISYYIYGDMSALIDFSEDNVKVYVIHSETIANFYRDEFNKIWQQAEKPKTE